MWRSLRTARSSPAIPTGKRKPVRFGAWIATDMGTTNGIEVSPDGTKLYVNETVQRRVWRFALHPDGGISDKSLLIEFPDHGLDGMRCDIDGHLYITRFGKGTVVKVSPKGEVMREIDVLGT